MVHHASVFVLASKWREVWSRCKPGADDDRLAVPLNLHWSIELHLGDLDIPPELFIVPMCCCDPRIETDIFFQTPYFVNVLEVVAKCFSARVLLCPVEILEKLSFWDLVDRHFSVNTCTW